MATQFLATIKNRRTYYSLKKESPIPDSRIQEIIRETLLHVPSSFNVQSTRVVLLLKEEHDKFWEIVRDVLRGIVPAESFEPTSQKLDGFKAAYGTALFFIHRPSIQQQIETYPGYADKFQPWAEQSAGMHQFALWTALEAEGLGANLQHYNPIADEKVLAQWDIPKDWALNAQLVFGTSATAEPSLPKKYLPVEDRFKVFGA